MKIVLSILASALFLGLATAQEPTPSPKTAALAEELLGLFQVDKAMDGAFQQIVKMEEQMPSSKNLTPEEKAKRSKALQASLEESKKAFSWETIKPTFIQIYSEVFTEEELQGMIDFFKSPIGQKWIAKQPQLQAATMQKMQGLMMELQPKIKAAIEKSTKEAGAPAKAE
jgi:hypothetical protein